MLAQSLKKLPPDVARELLRHVKPRTPKPSSAAAAAAHASSSQNASRNSKSSAKIVLGCLTVLGGMAAIPYIATARIQNLTDRDDPLTPSQVQRGAFMNSGSKDAGRDPNWDWKNGKYVYSKGFADHLKKQSPNETDFGPDLVGPAVQVQNRNAAVAAAARRDNASSSSS
mmetsp:Transcript_14340/g.40820  ORF Transcript_14340/g.40820 Transcript_14340/m.40820 type:complete len:170 (-) Transcript_14340:161-670(-)|eukprot:CAMPEP_0119560610 /NCGR_PEP_ID=MMETSP1352-20130426/15405_1 /TAXON_ID=265584 /ORGANISM="Stauroneis constricta, Strain CCMP1120" /LENGTH=169 /DNA_ID=CAMNT_0007608635 /DNA_START=143 /DNA_END=652 /DNA_ORIENTATION=-